MRAEEVAPGVATSHEVPAAFGVEATSGICNRAICALCVRKGERPRTASEGVPVRRFLEDAEALDPSVEERRELSPPDFW